MKEIEEEGWNRRKKVKREKGRLRGKEKYRELRNGQGRKVEGKGKRKGSGR